MPRSLVVAAALLATLPATAFAQDVYTKSAKAQFDMIKANLSKTAAKVPEDVYSFKPTPEVRSFAELIGHVADANFMICGAAAGEKAPQGGFEKKTAKAELAKALDDSIAYCDKVIASLDDVKGAATVQFFTGPAPKLGVIFFNISHCNEHYGNLVTYMRLKNIVPPSSERSR
jgi:uncharacterized damage-inducible protein DinB